MTTPTLFAAGQTVTVTKLSSMNPGDLPDGYWAKGVLVSDITVGRPIHVARTERSRKTPSEPPRVETAGEFTSSPVESISGDRVKTANSVWHVRVATV